MREEEEEEEEGEEAEGCLGIGNSRGASIAGACATAHLITRDDSYSRSEAPDRWTWPTRGVTEAVGITRGEEDEHFEKRFSSLWTSRRGQVDTCLPWPVYFVLTRLRNKLSAFAPVFRHSHRERDARC
ncbi:hypothetical protein AOLI_G00066690 [Acnodon oligacanthus]